MSKFLLLYQIFVGVPHIIMCGTVAQNNRVGVSPLPSDSLSAPDSTGYKYPKKSPAVALFLSILPGGGQFYTENYLKGVVFGGAQLYFGGGTVYLHLQAKNAKKREDTWEYEWYSNQRNNFLWWDALVWALSMGDAYVSAHFYKFKEQGKLKIDTGYKILNLGNAFTLCLTKSF